MIERSSRYLLSLHCITLAFRSRCSHITEIDWNLTRSVSKLAVHLGWVQQVPNIALCIVVQSAPRISLRLRKYLLTAKQGKPTGIDTSREDVQRVPAEFSRCCCFQSPQNVCSLSAVAALLLFLCAGGLVVGRGSRRRMRLGLPPQKLTAEKLLFEVLSKAHTCSSRSPSSHRAKKVVMAFSP